LEEDDDAPGVFNKMPMTSVSICLFGIPCFLKDVSCLDNCKEAQKKLIDRPTSDYERACPKHYCQSLIYVADFRVVMSETSYHFRAWALAHFIMKLFYCSLFSP
jgi:hypothetical protein